MFKVSSVFDIKINIWSILLFLIVAFNFNFFYLLPDFSFGPFALGDIDWLLILLVFIIIVIRYFNYWINNLNKKFIIFEIITILLIITSSFQASKIYGQSLLQGISPQRELIIFPLLYFSYDILIKNNKISVKTLKDIIFAVTFIIMILGFTQVFIGVDRFKFINALSNERYGDTRLYLSTSLMSFCMFIAFSELLFSKKVSFFKIIYIIMVILFLGFVTKSRMVFISNIVGLLVSFTFFTKINLRKKLPITAFVVALLVCILFTPIGQDIMDIIVRTSINETSEIREAGREFYINAISNNKLLGWGYVNILNPLSESKSGITNNIFWVDNGVYGFAFYYGLLGIFVIIVLYIFLIIKSLKSDDKKRNYAIGFIVETLVSMMTIFTLGMTPNIVLFIFMLLLDFDFEEKISIVNNDN